MFIKNILVILNDARRFPQIALVILFLGAFSCTPPSPPALPVEVSPAIIDWANQNECLKNLWRYEVEDENLQHIDHQFYKDKATGKTLYMTCETERGVVFHQLPYDIHFESFESLGEYAVDKDAVYHYYMTSSGNKILLLEGADRASFQVFEGTIYAKDNRYVYDSRHGIIEEADLETFEPLLDFDIKPLAKDKHHIYFWDKIIEDTNSIQGLREYLDK
jgi:hypothetical protein